MADWTLGTGRDEHLSEHNQFDHASLASLDEGQVLGVVGGKIKQVAGKALAVFVNGSPDYNAESGDTVILVETVAQDCTIYLPSASDFDLQSIIVKRIAGSFDVIIERDGTDLINTDGAQVSSKTLESIGASWSATCVVARAQWYTIGEYGTVT